MRLLGLFGNRRADPPYENIPCFKDIAYPEDHYESVGIIIGPPKMPKDVTDKLIKAFKVAITDPEYQKFFRSRYYLPNVFVS